MDSDENGQRESKFYYTEEETLNQMTPINRDEDEQDRHLNNIQERKKMSLIIIIFIEETFSRMWFSPRTSEMKIKD